MLTTTLENFLQNLPLAVWRGLEMCLWCIILTLRGVRTSLYFLLFSGKPWRHSANKRKQHWVHQRGRTHVSVCLSIPKLTSWPVCWFFLNFPPGLRKRRTLLRITLNRRSRALKGDENVWCVWSHTCSSLWAWVYGPLKVWDWRHNNNIWIKKKIIKNVFQKIMNRTRVALCCLQRLRVCFEALRPS